jgi:hypothetical protein
MKSDGADQITTVANTAAYPLERLGRREVPIPERGMATILSV